MAVSGNGTSAHVSGAAFPAPTRYTIHLWYSNPSVPGTGSGTKIAATMVDSGVGNYEVDFTWMHASTPKSVYHKQAAGGFAVATFGTAFAANTFYGIGIRYDGTKLSIWVNGVKDTEVSATDPTSSFNPAPCVLAWNGGAGFFDAGTAAEACFWTVALSDAEMLALGQGAMPFMVHPASQAYYWQLIRDIFEFHGFTTTTANTAVAAHPRMYYPNSQDGRYFQGNAAYIFLPDGGSAKQAGSATVTTAYTWVADGGTAKQKGTATVYSDASFSTTVNLALTTSGPPGFQSRANFAHLFQNVDNYVIQTTRLQFGHRFVADTGELANGHYRR